MKKIVALMAIILSLTTVCPLASTLEPTRESSPKQTSNYPIRAKEIIAALQGVIDDFIPTGNANIDYLEQMVSLNSDLIRFSLAIQSNSNNPQIIKIANDIIADEAGQLKEMRLLKKQLLENYKIGSQNDNEYIKKYKEITDEMINAFNNYKATGNDTIDYLNYVLTGNAATIELSKVASKYITDDTTKKIAENYIKLENEQSSNLDKLLKLEVELENKNR